MIRTPLVYFFIDEEGVAHCTEDKLVKDSFKKIVWVPTSEVKILKITLPGKSKKIWEQALPFAVERKITENIEDYHLVLMHHEPDNDDAYVMAVQRDKMANWMASVKGISNSKGIPDNRLMLVPSCFMLPLDLKKVGESVSQTPQSFDEETKQAAEANKELESDKIPASEPESEINKEVESINETGLMQQDAVAYYIEDKDLLKIRVGEFLGFTIDKDLVALMQDKFKVILKKVAPAELLGNHLTENFLRKVNLCKKEFDGLFTFSFQKIEVIALSWLIAINLSIFSFYSILNIKQNIRTIDNYHQETRKLLKTYFPTVKVDNPDVFIEQLKRKLPKNTGIKSVSYYMEALATAIYQLKSYNNQLDMNLENIKWISGALKVEFSLDNSNPDNRAKMIQILNGYRFNSLRFYFKILNQNKGELIVK